MYKLKFSLLFIIISCSLLIDCTGKKNPGKKETLVLKSDSAKTTDPSTHIESGPTPETIPESLRDLQNNSKFIITIDERDNDYPKSNISVFFAEKKIEISSISGGANLIDKNEYKHKNIPVETIAACGAWWAGSGDYFYIIPSKTGIAVFQGWQDEAQEDEGFHWKKIREINP